MRKRLVWLAVVVATVLAGIAGAQAEPFKDGDRVCFLGDSITARGQTQTMVANYYLTRFPDKTIRFVNAGRPGDSAGGALGRLADDVIQMKPTAVVVMLGMNDVGRGSYVANPDARKKAAQRQALDNYKANMDKLVGRIRAEAGQARLLLCTPSPFDETVVLTKDNNQPGCNGGLGQCAEMVRALAGRTKATVVEYHAPMTALNLQQQKRDPSWTIVGGDRVHPGAPGFLMMAWLFLKTQDVPALVSKVVIDAASGRALPCANAEVTAVEKRTGGVTFTVLEKALPFPIDPAAGSLLELLPIQRDLNQQLVVVTGLAEGRYAVQIDGKVIARHTAAELAKGIDLGARSDTPQYKQALEMARHNELRRSAETQARSLLNTRRWMQSHYKVDVDDPAAVQRHYDSFKDKTEYNAVMAMNYIKRWSQYDTFCQQVRQHENDALASRQPAPHVYTIAPLADDHPAGK